MRVVVADDAMLTREGIVRLLREADVDVVAEAENADDLLRHVGVGRPDAAIVDIRMPPIPYRRRTRRRATHPR